MTGVLKVIVTNRSAARAKYGAAGWAKVRHAVVALVAADSARGVTTRMLAIDAAADTKKVGATPIAHADDVAGIKLAIDAIYRSWKPAYLVLLGGPEILGTVNLNNPLWTGDPNDDPDRFIPSDLPYACEVALSMSPADYRGATRAVGRIPDLMGDTDPAVLVAQLARSADATSFVRASPEPVFAVSAKVWSASTQKSIAGLPDVSGAVRTSPAEGPAWTTTDATPPIHFVNCHGGEFDPNWYGQQSPNNWNLPTAMSAASLPGILIAGTVVAAECCYGAAHWPPAAAHGQASLAMTYLAQGAAGVFGASTVAYGPATSNNYADVVCRLFVDEVLAGASLGRATLSARQRFVQSQSFLDPTDVKTLAQFNLLGDPSMVVFLAPPAAKATGKGRRHAVAAPHASAAVTARREMLTAIGDALQQTAVTCRDAARPRAAMTGTALAALLGREVPSEVTIRTFDADRTVRRAGGTERGPRAHVAFIPARDRRGDTLLVVREQPDGQREIRTAVRR
jgi:Peptidase family C25